MWLRVIDVPAALQSRGYDVSGELTLGVSGDTLTVENNGAWRLSVAADGNVVCSAEPGLTAVQCDIVLGMPGLAALFMGRRSATALALVGLAEGEPAALRAADGLFATRTKPHCADHY